MTRILIGWNSVLARIQMVDVVESRITIFTMADQFPEFSHVFFFCLLRYLVQPGKRLSKVERKASTSSSRLLYTPFVLQSLYTEQSTLKVPLFVNTLAYSPYIRDTSLIVSWPSKISSLRIISTLKEILPNRNLKILSIFSFGKIFHTKD